MLMDIGTEEIAHVEMLATMIARLLETSPVDTQEDMASIAGFIPGTYHAVYNASKAFFDSFSFALRSELKESGVTVTCLMLGETETECFERADLTDTKVGQSKKEDPAKVARVGFDAMMRGDGDVVSGWQNKLQTAIASVTPAGMLAEQHKKAEPGGAKP